MNKNIKNLLGFVFDYLTVERFSCTKLSRGSKAAFWICKCKCGNVIEKSSYYLNRKDRGIKSCGCNKLDWMKNIFESNLEKTDTCWIWKGRLNQQGYGRIGSTSTAHRRSYEFYKGAIPKGLCVCHSCDTPACARPEHLFLGTFKENSQDAISKGRQAKGSKTGTSILNEDQVLEIRKMRISGKEYQEIADHFKVCWHTIGGICRNECWKHVPLGEESKVIPQIRRTPIGAKSHKAKLTDSQVVEIRRLAKSGMNGKQISKLFPVHYSVIARVIKRKIWRHVSD